MRLSTQDKEQKMKEFFEEHKFRSETLKIIEQANTIIEEYQEDGFDLTLRQLYYQFVSRDLIPNTQKSYSRLGDIISNARLNGNIDWETIKDRTRNVHSNIHFNNPSNAIYNVSNWYSIDTRADQENYIECWVEKEALVGVVERACEELDIPFFACRGYVSQTAMYEAYKRFHRKHNKHNRIILLHLGDHDPSGIDMTRDITERLINTFGVYIEVKRIALNMEQIEEFQPPPNPAKLTDSRVGGYIKRFGRQSWELDALDPNTITNLIRQYANLFTDQAKRNKLISLQKEQQNLIKKCSENWDNIVDYLERI
jgi:hypothetical protein